MVWERPLIQILLVAGVGVAGGKTEVSLEHTATQLPLAKNNPHSET